MNVSLRWLRDLAPGLPEDPEEIARRLTARGFPVEGVERLGAELDGLVVARVQEVSEHPDADRLKVCSVDGGEGVVQVVCGAPNVEAGGWYPFAPVGAVLPGGMEIGEVRLRGQESRGMLCSEVELGLGEDAGGLMALHDPDGSFRPGLPLRRALGLQDVRLDVEVTSNRPDLLSHVGLARECMEEGDGTFALPPVPGLDAPVSQAGPEWLETGPEPVEGKAPVAVQLEDPDRCPRYLAGVIRGVTVGPSPAWLQQRLRAVGARPVNNVVDATNLVLLELGQPLHAFDLARVRGGAVRVRRATDGETLRTLDGVDRTLDPDMLAICDARGPMAVAGVMGGEDSEVTAETRDLLLECALFEPGPIRATRKALGLSTDASYRFERGVDPLGLRTALLRAVDVILAVAGGEVDGPLVDAAAHRAVPATVPLRTSRVEALLGISIPAPDVEALLAPLGFRVAEREDDVLQVSVPGYRSWDVTREVDLIEEVARVHGYDRFPDTRRAWRPGTVPDDPLTRLEDQVRDTLVRLGLLEARTAAFVPRSQGEVEVANPVNMEERWLRSALAPPLGRRLAWNLARGNRDVRLFEVGTVFRPAPAPGDRPPEATHVAGILHGRAEPEHWSRPDRTLDAWDLKGIMEELSLVVGAFDGATNPWRVAPVPEDEARARGWPPLYSVLDDAGGTRGVGGVVPPGALDLPRWAGSVWWFEMSLPPAPEPGRVPPVRMPPTHPAVERDLALVVARDRAASDVLDAVRDRGGPHLQEVGVFDVYQGEGIPEGTRSLAVRLRFQAPDRTLVDAEVDQAVTRVVNHLQEAYDVHIRGG
ncbi:MAG: phenylalanine--tRNA ligase subunit beta [Gemmatimonadales bacterium]|nr:MAG: phenylalanine--tRNA ligase subunit beta [Gemmatimonadales bacterium]